MRRSIWKWEITIGMPVTFYVPRGAVFLSFQLQRGIPCAWAEVDPDAPTEQRAFVIRGTGHPYHPCVGDKYIGTAQDGPYVWHLFELGKLP